MLYIKFRYNGTLLGQEVRSGTKIVDEAQLSARLETPGTEVQADGEELAQALIIVTNGCSDRWLGRRVVTFVGDEARKIILNWK